MSSTISDLLYQPYSGNDSCSICLDGQTDDNPLFAHNVLHPLHLPCALEWIVRNSSCPICRLPVDSDRLRLLAPRQEQDRRGVLILDTRYIP
ncbi:MAG: RING finger domain-containing protein [Parachlamydiaceae bacterium]